MKTTQPGANFALRRIDTLTGRVFSVGALLLGAETVWHAIEQQQYFNTFWLWLAVGIMVVAQIGTAVNFWFLGARRWPYLLNGVALIFGFATWQLQIDGDFRLPAGTTPWLWTPLGVACIAVGMYAPRIWALAFMVLAPMCWVVLHASAFGGSEQIDSVVADAFYASLFPGTLVALVWMLRRAAMRADKTYEDSLAVQIQEVTKEAQLREQTRIDSIVYSSVFDTLKAAAKAKNAADYTYVVQASRDSLERIEAAKRPQPETITTMTLFETLEKIVAKIDPSCVMSIRGSSLTFLPKEVATALSDAAVQALNNSLQHAGLRAERKLHLKSTKHGVKLVISDNGIGFRPSKVPDQSLGFRFVIIKRVESVGGTVHIDSSPSNGTQIVLEWEGEA